MRPADAPVLDYFRVDPMVNSNRAAGPELIEPFDPGAVPRGQLI